MSQNKLNDEPSIGAEMTILDVISRYRRAESVFKQYDEKAKACLCCQALFDPLKDVADKYGLDLGQLLSDLKAAASISEA